jgi:hypothetical protein
MTAGGKKCEEETEHGFSINEKKVKFEAFY